MNVSRSARVIRGMLAMVIVAVVGAAGVTAASAEAPPIIACHNLYTGHIRIIQFNQQCGFAELRLEFQSTAAAAEDQDALQQQIDGLAARVGALEGRMDTAEGDIDTLEGRATDLEGRASDLEGRATDLEGRASDLEGRATDLEGRATDLEGRATDLEGRATDLEGRATDLEADVATLDTRVTNIRNFFTGVADDVIACFTDPGAVFSITIPEIRFDEVSTDVGGLLADPIVLIPEFVLFPETTIGFPVFNATSVVSCLNGVVTTTGL